MYLVVDTNVVISALLKQSITQDILFSREVSLSAPEYLGTEIMEHEKELVQKSKIPREKFELAVSIALSKIETFPKESYCSLKEEALGASPDPDDWPFLALSMKLGIPLWSNDKKLKGQNRVRVLNTKEIIDAINI